MEEKRLRFLHEEKADLYEAYHKNLKSSINFSQKALKGVVQSLYPAYFQSQSTSMMIHGSNQDAYQYIKQAHAFLLHESKKMQLFPSLESMHQKIGVVRGGLNDSDGLAIVSLVDQFCLRRNQDRNMNSLLEDLEIFFTLCKRDETPAVIIIEDFHVFSGQKRQTLIYTLLNLLHKSEYLFVVRSYYYYYYYYYYCYY
jgi:hypothetical protein